MWKGNDSIGRHTNEKWEKKKRNLSGLIAEYYEAPSLKKTVGSLLNTAIAWVVSSSLESEGRPSVSSVPHENHINNNTIKPPPS